MLWARPQRYPVGVLEPLLPQLPRRPDGRGCPWRDSREVLNAVLWIQGRIRWIRTGAQWSESPDRYLPYQSCHRRFQQWRRVGVIDRLLEVQARDLEERGEVDKTERGRRDLSEYRSSAASARAIQAD